jgi:hypothetical protein
MAEPYQRAMPRVSGFAIRATITALRVAIG